MFAQILNHEKQKYIFRQDYIEGKYMLKVAVDGTEVSFLVLISSHKFQSGVCLPDGRRLYTATCGIRAK